MEPFDRFLAGAGAHRKNTGRPLVTLTYAQSLDGSITSHRGQQLVLSGKETKILTHQLRAAHDAILVGIGTILADNPRLTARLVEGKNPQPVVLDSRLRFPLEARLLASSQQPPWIATTRAAAPSRRTALETAGARLLVLPEDKNGRVHLPALLERLADLGIERLMVEGGARVITGFLAGGLADLVILTVAPLFVGGLHAVEAVLEPDLPSPAGQPGISPAAEGRFPRLKEWDCKRYGDDLVIWGTPDWGSF